MPTDAQRRQQASAHHAEVQKLNERIAALTAENTRLEGLVYTPGLWRCAKCNFVLVQRNLNANSGAITARDQPGDKCPNCDVNLWRITERENARDNYETAERLHIELNEAKGFIALLEQQLAEARNPPTNSDDCWCESCDLVLHYPLRTRMSICPQCGDKRCPKAKHHDSQCRQDAAITRTQEQT